VDLCHVLTMSIVELLLLQLLHSFKENPLDFLIAVYPVKHI